MSNFFNIRQNYNYKFNQHITYCNLIRIIIRENGEILIIEKDNVYGQNSYAGIENIYNEDAYENVLVYEYVINEILDFNKSDETLFKQVIDYVFKEHYNYFKINKKWK